MDRQRKWIIGIVAVIVVVALLACGIFFAWRYFLPQKPVVAIDSPPSNTEVQEGDSLWVEVTASGGSIDRVELWVDDERVDRVESPSPVDTFRAGLSWLAAELGRHMVEVRAYNTQGQESDPAAIVIRVVPLVGEASPTPSVGPAEETPSPTPPPGATATPTSPPPTPTPTLAPPVISSFTIDDDTITDGETTTLRWEFSNATESHLYRNADEIASGLSTPGSRPVNPHVTRTFKLVVSNAAGSAEASVTLTVTPAVTPAPVIHYFKVNGVEGDISINAGDSVTLEWDTENAWGGVTLNGVGVTSPGSKTETPGSTTTYTLIADNGAGDVVSLSRTVTVVPAGPTTVTRNPMGGNESGSVYDPVCSLPVLYTHAIAGDNNTNCVRRGYMSFDISDLSGVHIVSAQLDITGCPVTGDPFGSSLNGIRVDHTTWSLPLDQADWAPSAGTDIVWLHSKPVSPIDVAWNVTYSLDHGWDRFQVMMRPAGPSDGDNAVDWINCHLSVPVLTITYEP